MTIRFGNKIIAGYPDKFVFSLVPVPASATVTITGGTQVKNAVIAKAGTSVHWKVEAAGYEPMEGDKVIGNADESLMVELVELPKEMFKFTINSGSDSSFILPLSSAYSIENNLTPYNMNVDWGDGKSETITGNVSDGHGVTHTYANSNQDYDITLTPAGDEDGWMCGLGFNRHKTGCNVSTNRAKVKKLSSPYTEKMIIRGGNKHNIMSYVWYGCSGLTTIEPGFNMPQGIMSVGEYFCANMFAYCSSLATLPDGFNLPQGITGVVGVGFCEKTFSNCSSLTTLPENFSIPHGITSVGEVFCRGMFQSCSSLTTLPDGFNLPQGITGVVGGGLCLEMFAYCSSLTTLPDGFNLPQGITGVVGFGFCEKMFLGCHQLSKLPSGFSLPQRLTAVPEAFCSTTFQHCSALKTGARSFFGGLVLPAEELNKSSCFASTFGQCTSLTEEISPATIPQLAVSPSSSNGCFSGCPNTSNCPANWK